MIRFSINNILYSIAILYLIFFGVSCTQKNAVEPHTNPTGGSMVCMITSLSDSLPIGGGKVTLLWTSHNASSASIAPNIGAVATSGVTTIYVKKTTMFILTVSNGTASVSDTILIVVSTPGGLSCDFTVSSDSLPFGGGRVTLTWSSQVATSASITPDIGAVATSGDTTIDVTKTTMFVLTVSNNGYFLSDTITIVVTPIWEFIYPLAVGNSWTYDYNYYYSGSSTTRVIHGVHTWSVVSKDSLYDHISFQMLDQEIDTLISGSKPQVQTASKTFFVVVSNDSIFVNWTNLVREAISQGAGIGHFPRFFTTQQDTLDLGGLPEAVYVSTVGLVKYSNGSLSAQTFITEGMELISSSTRSSRN